ncbi:hypothetical protein PHMEG_00021848 [Phytophthora megakarya]|uniref:Uncharacterized protein n=1 Tax=Phytophthora megakarya TaxID=4795 RepID=A0A225VM60_9STRA|nr:hypothetical protein PHMEG_00021848 [Phytophthora megakarya]
MSTLLKRMLDRHRVSQVACTLGTSKTTLELGNSSDDARSARRDFALLERAFNQQVAEILEQAQTRLSESERDFQKSTAVKNKCFEMKMPRVPKPQVTLKISTVDLTEPSSTESTPAKIQRKLFGGSKPKALTDFQLRPSTYTPSMTDTLDPTTAKQLSTTKAREGPDSTNIQELMRSHMSYDEALAAARADAEIHSHLDARHLIAMLEAESKLAKALTSGEVPTRWPNLRKDIQDDAVEIMAALYDSVTEEEDDEGRDATFSPDDDSQNKPQRRTTPPRQAKRGRDITSDSSSKSKPKRTSSPPKKRAKSGNGKKSRPGQERKQTALARKSYGSLSDSEKWIVEVPGQGILSWRHYGALMKLPPGTANAVTQSFGFPDYAPNLAKDEDVQALRERWDPVAFKELMDTKPWDVMFEDRSKCLILHVRDNLEVVGRESLDAIVAFMSVHRRAIWWFGHWVFIDLETDDPYSVELHRERKAECDKAKNEYKKLPDHRVDAGLEETILDEPGSWTIPAKCCHWILMYELHVKDDGTRYTLNEQNGAPAHVQWNTCASDEDCIKHLPEGYPLKLLKGSQRSSQKNRVTMDFD